MKESFGVTKDNQHMLELKIDQLRCEVLTSRMRSVWSLGRKEVNGIDREILAKFEKPVTMADGSYAMLGVGIFSQGDLDCDKCIYTIYAAKLRWQVEFDHGVVKRYHYYCYQPILKA